ncbi:MAG: response regulator [Chitinivibrionales bacterium]|nr:response regulator [Chitinivibrionales bacterium]MBD3356304.1 response regulator [Chitinivibrionales bacterium]
MRRRICVRILVVDDSKMMRHVLSTDLKDLGYATILEADCTDKAKEICSATSPDLIISDWNMPGESGLEFLKFIRSSATLKDTPFIMLTTQTNRAKIMEATRVGLQSYLLKPIRKSVLADKISELAAAYGFVPPAESKANTHAANAVGAERAREEHTLKGKIKPEHIPKILEAYAQLWRGEFSAVQLEEYMAEEVFGGSLPENLEEVNSLTKTLHDAVRTSIDRKLRQLIL